MNWFNKIFRKIPLEQKFFEACNSGNLAVVRECIKKGVNTNYTHRDAKGATGLYASIANKHEKVSNYLLTLTEVDVNIPLSNGMTCLMASIQLNQPNTFYKLMGRPEIKLDAQTFGTKASALHYACHGSEGITYEAMAMSLIKKGADVNLIRAGNTTALILVAENGNKRVAQALLDYDADTEVREDMWNRTAAGVAVFNGHPEIAQLIGDFKRKRQANALKQSASQTSETDMIQTSGNDKRQIPGVCVTPQRPASLIPTSDQSNQRR